MICKQCLSICFKMNKAKTGKELSNLIKKLCGVCK